MTKDIFQLTWVSLFTCKAFLIFANVFLRHILVNSCNSDT